jgi:hypothetical protein
MNPLVEPLEPLAQALRDGLFEVDAIELPALGICLLAETPHAVVLCVRATWESLNVTSNEAQAQLTHLAAGDPSARNWDLYVVIAITQVAGEAEEVARERLEHDTRYARKLIVAGPAITDPLALHTALRPLLPIRPTASVHLADPLAAMHEALLTNGLDGPTVGLAITSFSSTGEVDVS